MHFIKHLFDKTKDSGQKSQDNKERRGFSPRIDRDYGQFGVEGDSDTLEVIYQMTQREGERERRRARGVSGCVDDQCWILAARDSEKL